jgi:hypothetical protein
VTPYVRSGGGGGFGSPLERPAERVQVDVREGYVSVQAARDYYGVVLDHRTLAIDAIGTAAERASLADMHRRRMEKQKTLCGGSRRRSSPTSRLNIRVMPCLRLSCCGRFLFPMDDEGRPIG